MADIDIIILGAGISGLLLGSELSKYHSVLVVEKKEALALQKYWVTNSACIKESPEFKSFISNRFNHMDFIAYDNTKFRCTGNYILWDSKQLIEYLSCTIIKNNGIILYNSQFYSYKDITNGMEVFIDNQIFNCRIIIDCMGYDSPLVYAKNIIDIRGFYILYGKVLEIKQDVTPICLHNVLVNKKPRYLEVFPINSNKAYVALLVPEKELSNIKDTIQEFDFIVSKSIYSDYFTNSSNYENNIFGIVPVGKLKKSAIDRIYFYGESAQINPAATGTCLTRMLYDYKSISKQLSYCIQKNKLKATDLPSLNSSMTTLNRLYQLSLYKDVLNWDSDRFLGIVRKLKYISPKIINDVLFGEMKIKDIFTLNNIFNIFKNRLFFVVKPLLKAIIN